MQVQFGTGTVVGKRTDISNSLPSFVGVLQDISIDFDQSLVTLFGQNKMPVDIAPGELKINGKAKFARIQAATLNNLVLGSTLTASTSGQDMATNESGLVAAAARTVTNGATFIEDLGVFTSTGVQLQPVAAAPVAAVSYIPGAVGVGTYTFNATDNGQTYFFYYSYTLTNANMISLSNALMGTGPVFSLTASMPYTVVGNLKKFVFKLNACRGAKMSFPFKNTAYMIPEFDFQAYADANGNIMTWTLTE